jgi:hypothetical protein
MGAEAKKYQREAELRQLGMLNREDDDEEEEDYDYDLSNSNGEVSFDPGRGCVPSLVE